jgi:hypothetical protein
MSMNPNDLLTRPSFTFGAWARDLSSLPKVKGCWVETPDHLTAANLRVPETTLQLLGQKVPIRIEKPHEVVQEISPVPDWEHWAMRHLISEAAEQAQLSPLTLLWRVSLQGDTSA